MNNNILISKTLLNDMNNSELCVYLAVYYIAQKERECFISFGHIEHVLYEAPRNKKDRETISDGFKKLVSRGYIKTLQEYKGSGYYCDVSKISIYDNRKTYVSIEYHEMRKFMDIKDCSKYNLMRYFIVLISSFDGSKSCDEKYRFKIGKMPETYMAELCKISLSSLMKYNKVLQDKFLIYISKRKTYSPTKDGDINTQWQSNIYSRYRDKELCDEYAKSTSSTVDTKTYGRQINESRRHVQMYNAMLKGKEYDEDTVVEIYEGIKYWNEDKKKKYEEQIEQGFRPSEPKYKDLKVFEKYGLTG